MYPPENYVLKRLEELWVDFPGQNQSSVEVCELAVFQIVHLLRVIEVAHELVSYVLAVNVGADLEQFDQFTGGRGSRQLTHGDFESVFIVGSGFKLLLRHRAEKP